MAEEHASGAIEALPIDTRPGENHVFSPPAGFNGGFGAYRYEMQRRWAESIAARQQISICLSAFENNSDKETNENFIGPYAEKAKEILIKLKTSKAGQ